MEINQEVLDKVQELAKTLSKAFYAIYEALMKFTRWFLDNLKWIKGNVIELQQLEIKRTIKKQLHRMDFTRPKISHQIIDRRPKNMNRKIIR